MYGMDGKNASKIVQQCVIHTMRQITKDVMHVNIGSEETWTKTRRRSN